MDNIDPDLVNLLDTQADQTDVTNVHLRSTQEDTSTTAPCQTTVDGTSHYCSGT